MHERSLRFVTRVGGERVGRGAEKLNDSVPRKILNSCTEIEKIERDDVNLERGAQTVEILINDVELTQKGPCLEKNVGDDEKRQGSIEESNCDRDDTERERSEVLGRGAREISQCMGDDSEEIIISGVLTENRNFLSIVLAGVRYRALLDPATMISLVGPKVAERLRARLEPNNTLIQTVTGKLCKVLGAFEVNIELESVVRKIQFKAFGDLEQEIILGMDFCRDFDFEIKLGQGVWKIGGGA